MAKETMSRFCSEVSLKTRRLRTSCVITMMSLYRLLLLMTVAPMVVSAATHGVNGVGIDYATGALTSLLAFSLHASRACERASMQDVRAYVRACKACVQGLRTHINKSDRLPKNVLDLGRLVAQFLKYLGRLEAFRQRARKTNAFHPTA